MKLGWTLITALFWLGVAGIAVGWAGHLMPGLLTNGHLLDWVMGALCLGWLIVLLKAPWDLYFQAQAALFEMQRARERQIKLPAGREEYVRTLRTRLGWLAVAAHLGSAALLAALAFLAGHVVGYYFAAFYVISTVFRPAVAGYVYLAGKLRAIGQEAHYPREDIVDALERLSQQEAVIRDLTRVVHECRQNLQQESQTREEEEQRIRLGQEAMGREMERALSRLTDNQEVIAGIQAFVRLVGQARPSA